MNYGVYDPHRVNGANGVLIPFAELWFTGCFRPIAWLLGLPHSFFPSLSRCPYVLRRHPGAVIFRKLDVIIILADNTTSYSDGVYCPVPGWIGLM